MNHLLEAWITWIKHKPYFTARPNPKLDALKVWSGRGSKQNQKKRGEGKKDLWGIALCQSEGGGVAKTHTHLEFIFARDWGRNQSWKYNGKWMAMKKGRWREQRQWLIHEPSHVLNFLKELGGMSEGGMLKDESHSLHYRRWETKRFCT